MSGASRSDCVREVAVAPLAVPLREPFGIAGGAQAVAEGVLVTITLADGSVGFGEAAPLPAYNGETQAGTLEALREAMAIVQGASASRWRPLARELREAIPGAGSARCALETALLDAWLRQRGLPMSSFFGGSSRELQTDITITTGSERDAFEAASRWSKAGFSKLKIKVGGGALELDVARAAAAARACPGARITLDANASLESAAAIELVQRLRALGIELVFFEQPTRAGDWEELVRVARHVTVAADENVVTGADALVAAARLGAPHVINIKLMKAGIVEALDVAAVARAAGMGLMIGGNVESILAMTVSAQLACGLGGFEHVDLDTPLFFASNPFRGGFSMSGPDITLDEAPGHGVSPL